MKKCDFKLLFAYFKIIWKNPYFWLCVSLAILALFEKMYLLSLMWAVVIPAVGIILAWIDNCFLRKKPREEPKT